MIDIQPKPCEEGPIENDGSILGNITKNIENN